MQAARRALLALVALLAGVPVVARAQGPTGGIGSSVTILYAPLSASGIRPLEFGVLLPGQTATVLPRTPMGAEFRITGTMGHKSMDITFTLPTALVKAGGGPSIPVNFNGNYAALCEINASNVCQVASVATWNPVTMPTFFDKPTRYQPGRPRYTVDVFSVYLGGQIVIPAAGLPAGTYSGTIGVVLALN